MDKKYIVAIEISGSQIKGALASVDPSPHAHPAIEAIVADDQISCVRYGRVQNLADAAKHVSSVLARLQSHPSIKGRPIQGVYVGIAGRSLTSIPVSVKLELPTEMEITPDILRRLFMEASKNVPVQKMVLKVLPRRFMVDNQVISKPEGVLGHRLQGDFTLVTCNPVNRKYIDMIFDDRIKLPILSDIVTPLAIADMVLGNEEKELGCVLVDMGAQTTTVAVYKERCLQYIATLPIGSHNITRDLSLGLNISEEKAETAKCTQGDALPDGVRDEAPRINGFVQARANEIIANIKAQIEFAGLRTADMGAGFVLTGRGVRLRNFDRLLENNTKMHVRTAQIPADIDFRLPQAVDPADYISLVAIVDKVCRNADSESCVQSLPEAPTQTTMYTVEEQTAHTQPASEWHEPVQTPQGQTYPRQHPETYRPAKPEVDDDQWDKDDPLPGQRQEESRREKKQRKAERGDRANRSDTPKRSMAQFLKDQWSKLLDTSDIEKNDTPFDE